MINGMFIYLNTYIFRLTVKYHFLHKEVAFQFSTALKYIIYNAYKYINWCLLFWSTEGRKRLFPSLAQGQPLK